MSLQYERSRQLAAEIENTKVKWGVRCVNPPNGTLKIEAKKKPKMPETPPIPSSGRKQQVLVSEKPSETDCQQKSCYCCGHRTPKKPESQKLAKKAEMRVTWDQILSQHLNLEAKPEQLPALRNQFCQVDEKHRLIERPKSSGNDTLCRRTLDDWCHTACFVKDLALNQPGDLLLLKTEIDQVVKNMGLRDCCPPDEPLNDVNRPKVVLEYLEELSFEMLKKRLEENESKFKNTRKKLEEAIVTQKLEIQSLKSELYLKNEEVTRLMKYQEALINSSEVKRKEMEFIERVSSLDDRIKIMMEKEEKTNKELEKSQREVTELRLALSHIREERDLFHAKMEIYQQERDKAVASLSVYEKTFKNLKHELGEEMRGIRPPLELTADSCGTLETIGRVSRDVVTSSPNVSFQTISNQKDNRKSSTKTPSQSKKRTKHTLPECPLLDMPPISSTVVENKENAGQVLLQKLNVLGKEFKQFSQNVFPLALRLDDEANQLLNASTSSGLSWTDLNSGTISSSQASPSMKLS